MAEIIYFGTYGRPGHYPIGVDKALTGAEKPLCQTKGYHLMVRLLFASSLN